jgi:hypothetical protein
VSKSKTTPEERKQIIDMFNTMDPGIPDRYAQIGEKFNRSTSTCFTIIKAAQKKEPEIKYFNPREPQFLR